MRLISSSTSSSRNGLLRCSWSLMRSSHQPGWSGCPQVRASTLHAPDSWVRMITASSLACSGTWPVCHSVAYRSATNVSTWPSGLREGFVTL